MTGAGRAGAAELTVARALFGDRLPRAQQYAELLGTTGVAHGLLGPHEAGRIWSRHLLNSAVVAELLPAGVTVVDVGSGAGLPGIPLALARPDLRVTLVEPMLRRTTFLTEALSALALADRVGVVRARAEQYAGETPAVDVVVARALAPLDRLARWCLPLVRTGGLVLALKGASAGAEVAAHAAEVRRLGGSPPTVVRCGTGLVDPPTTVIQFRRPPTR